MNLTNALRRRGIASALSPRPAVHTLAVIGALCVAVPVRAQLVGYIDGGASAQTSPGVFDGQFAAACGFAASGYLPLAGQARSCVLSGTVQSPGSQPYLQYIANGMTFASVDSSYVHALAGISGSVTSFNWTGGVFVAPQFSALAHATLQSQLTITRTAASAPLTLDPAKVRIFDFIQGSLATASTNNGTSQALGQLDMSAGGLQSRLYAQSVNSYSSVFTNTFGGSNEIDLDYSAFLNGSTTYTLVLTTSAEATTTEYSAANSFAAGAFTAASSFSNTAGIEAVQIFDQSGVDISSDFLVTDANGVVIGATPDNGFRISTTPEASTLGLVATGLLALLGAGEVRKRTTRAS